jgi:hypothetical protein
MRRKDLIHIKNDIRISPAAIIAYYPKTYKRKYTLVLENFENTGDRYLFNIYWD